MSSVLTINPKHFDEVVWQTETSFTQEEYQTWLNGAISTLQEIYDTYEGDGDVYVLGDIINMLGDIKIKARPNRKEEGVYMYRLLIKIPNTSGWEHVGSFYTLEDLYSYAKGEYGISKEQIVHSTERKDDNAPYMWQRDKIW